MSVQISKAQILFYRENGFVQIDDILTAEELAELRDALDEVLSE